MVTRTARSLDADSSFLAMESLMNDNQVFVKTALGSDELRSRARRLPSRVRTMLIMVDGMQTLAQLNAAAASIGAPEACMAFLLEQGLVQPKPKAVTRAPAAAATTANAVQPVDLLLDVEAPELTDAARYLAAQKLMNDSAVDALGLRAFFFTLKLERAFTCDDLRAALPDLNKALAKGKDPAAAALIEARVRVLLGHG
jgi:hypothetical protein